MKTKLLLVFFFTIISAISFAQWSAPVILSPAAISAGLNESMGSCIGTSGGDTVHVVWTDKLSPKKAALYYTRSLDTGLTWSAPIAITSLSKNAWNPAIAVNGLNIHVAWREIDTISGHRASWYKHSLDGGVTWGPNVFLDSTADWPAISVSGNNVYIANDSITAAAPYNTEIFFKRSTDNGVTWSAHQQLSFAVGRSEDEAIHAEGSHVHMSWNDNRTGQFQIFYKESADYGVTWGPDIVVDVPYDYSTMVWSDGANVDVVAAGAPTGPHDQILLTQSSDNGATWGAGKNISNDTAHTYFYPDMVRNGSDLHVVSSGSAGARYLHSADGGTMWDPPYTFTGGSTFIAYTGCALHIIYVNAAKKICYIRNPTGNAGHCSIATGITENQSEKNISVYPNPSSGVINIAGSAMDNGNYKFSLKNIIGQIILEDNTIVENNSVQKTISVSNVPNGIYFMTIETGKQTIIKKLVVQN